MAVPKFMAWHKPMQRMSEVLAISFERQKVKIRHLRGTTHMTVPFDDVIFMQSTGMFDINSQEIFEGDVVIAWSQGLKGTFEIKRRIDGLWLLYPAWKDAQFWYLSPTEDFRETIEIIGDIYRNPELVDRQVEK